MNITTNNLSLPELEALAARIAAQIAEAGGSQKPADNVEIIALLDRSGSMGSMTDDAIGGFNTFLADQKALPGEARLTVALFDHEYQELYTKLPLADARPLDRTTYSPRGSTALYDAVGRTLNNHRLRIAAEGWAKKTIVCILTDGQENASKEFDAASVRQAISDAEKAGWSFVFLAANQDAFATGASLGINPAHTACYAATSEGTREAYQVASSNVSKLRGG